MKVLLGVLAAGVQHSDLLPLTSVHMRCPEKEADDTIYMCFKALISACMLI